MKPKSNPDLDGWTPWTTSAALPDGWVLLKHPNQFPRAYLSHVLPKDLNTQNLYWRQPSEQRNGNIYATLSESE